MSNAVERTVDGWCVKVTKSTAKKKHVTTYQSSNNLNHQQHHHGPDIFKKFENYIIKAHKFKEPEHLLHDLQELRDIAVKLHSNSSSTLLEWTTK
jgi:hypothetical protein